MTAFVDLRRGEASDRPPGALIFATDPENRVLLQLRDDRPGVNWGGYWGLFGGGVEPDDADLSHAAQREFHEEVGLSLPLERFLPMAQLTSTSPMRTPLFVFRLTGAVEPQDITLGEGAGFGFFTSEQVEHLTLVPSLTDVMALWRKETL